jgi:hypothetical protein
VKAAWFSPRWYIITEVIVQNSNSLTQILLNILNMPHPYATIQNVLTFMWCIWKSRNDCLFDRRKGEPYQIHINAMALKNNLELVNLPNSNLQMQHKQTHHTLNSKVVSQGETIATDIHISGPKIFSDATWKKRQMFAGNSGLERTGIGVFLQFADSGDRRLTVMIQASAPPADSVLQAEAKAMLLAALVAQALHIHKPTMLTDNKNLAKAVASKKLDSVHIHWNCRDTLADIFATASILHAQVFHIKRDLNDIAHNCAHQVLRSSPNAPTFGCTSSAHFSTPCPVIATLQNSVWQGFVINDVLCC